MAMRDLVLAKQRGALYVRNLPLKPLVFATLCVLPIVGALELLSGQWFPWVLATYALASIVSFGLYWADKRNAFNQHRRIPENRLHLVELLGGWPGALTAQQVFRHKTRKPSFQIVFWAIILAHQAFWAGWLLAEGQYLSQ